MPIESSTINTFLVFFIAGILLALAAQFLSQRFYGRLVKALFSVKANDTESARTIEELGFGKNGLIKYALSHRTTLSFIVLSVTDENGTKRFYIPEENEKKAESFVKPDGFTLVSVVVLAACLCAVFLLCKYVIPYIFN